MKNTTVNYIRGLLKKYGKDWQRKTVIKELETVSRKEVAVQDMKLGYDPQTGYMGTAVKSEVTIACSRFHKILIFTKDYYQVMPVPEKLFIKDKLLYWGKMDKDAVFNCLYREQTSGIAYMKRFRVDKFILDREYPYTMENAKVLVLTCGPPPKLRVFYPKTGRIRITNEDVDFADLMIKGASARGNRVSAKAVTRIRVFEEKKKQEA